MKILWEKLILLTLTLCKKNEKRKLNNRLKSGAIAPYNCYFYMKCKN